MATEYGKESRIHVGDGETVEDFLPIAGEQSWDYSASSSEQDESSKDDADIAAMSYGPRKITISANGITKLPDDGLERVLEISKSTTRKGMVKLMKGAIVRFHGQVGVGNVKMTGSKDGPVTWSFDMVACATPIVDNLAASA
ncbi:phage tail tube protein [Sphingomonas hengshuiensis]|uniref:Phage tail protein n=1 Tax=Sphingomonas hengshuiensis TaxID=1609977 RepID=A0A7U4LG45_9SPHN|nr:hypothetical protein [Sphingomonas hengshuiensis]AJP72928.1 hypothetical protein TS85_15710 [Sphingomonas hengshuiensis]